MNFESVNEEVLRRWFTASTMPDPQLFSVIAEGGFTRKVPTFREACLQLFRVENVYQSYRRVDLIPQMEYPAHIGNNTLAMLSSRLGRAPKFGVEVGSFIGSSASVLGEIMRTNEGVLLCVDTWCGDINMWLMDRFSATMLKSDGNPKIYDRFMEKMISREMTECVIPLRVSSVVAARMLKVLNWEIDFVYLDSAHECGETFLELMLYYDVLRDGGCLFGDDYWGFPAVKHDLDLFCQVSDRQLEFTGDGDTWIIHK